MKTEIPVRGYFIHSVDGGEVGGRLEDVRIGINDLPDCQNCFHKPVEFFFPITFGGFDHKAEDLRECNGGGVETKIQKEFADLRDGFCLWDACSFKLFEVLFSQCEYKLMHARRVSVASW